MTEILTEELARGRNHTISLVQGLTREQFLWSPNRERSPIGWHLGHIGMVEAYWVFQRCQQIAPPGGGLNFLFSTSNLEENRLQLPEAGEILEYLNCVRGETVNYLGRFWDAPPDRLPRFEGRTVFELIINHEYQHAGTIADNRRLQGLPVIDTPPSTRVLPSIRNNYPIWQLPVIAGQIG